MKTTVGELEKEKYELLEKVKELEIAKTNVESDSKRKDHKLSELAIKVTQYATKLTEYKERSKNEQKNICGLVRRFASTLKEVNNSNHSVIEYVTKIFHGLAIQKEVDLGDLSLFDAKAAVNTLCGEQSSTIFKKIDWVKLKGTIMQNFGEIPNTKDAIKLFASTYKTLLARMESCQTSSSEVAMLCNNFEAHKNLMRESNALLRSSNVMRDSINLNSSRINLNDSAYFGSSRLDESLVGFGDETERSARKHMKRLSINNDSFLEVDTHDPFEASPRRKSMLVNTSLNLDDQNKQHFMRMVNEESTLQLNVFSGGLYNTKLEEKTLELKEMIEAHKKKLSELKSQKEILERSVEESFMELEGRIKINNRFRNSMHQYVELFDSSKQQPNGFENQRQ